MPFLKRQKHRILKHLLHDMKKTWFSIRPFELLVNFKVFKKSPNTGSFRFPPFNRARTLLH